MKIRIDPATQEGTRLYDSLPIGICLLDKELRYTFVNKRLAQIFGMSTGQCNGQTTDELALELATGLAPHLQQVLQTSEPLDDILVQPQATTKNTPAECFLCSISPYPTEDGPLTGLCCTIQELSPTLQTQLGRAVPQKETPDNLSKTKPASVREYEKRLRLIADAVPALVSYIDHENRYQYVNQFYEEYFGVRQEEIAGRKVGEILKKERLHEFRPRIAAVLAGGRVSFETTVCSRDGEFNTLSVQLIPDFGENDQVRGFFSMATDITELRRNEDALRASEEMWRSTTHTTHEQIVLISPDAIIQYINHTIGGFEIEDMVGTSIYEYISEDFQQSTAECIARVIETGQPGQFEVDYTDSTEMVYALEARVTPVKQDGTVVAMIINAQNVTDRKRAHEEIRIRARQQAAVAQLGLRALAGVDWPVLMSESVEMLADVLDVGFAKVMELIPEENLLLFRAVCGWDAEWINQRTIPMGETSQAGRAILSNEPIVVEELPQDARFPLTDTLRYYGIISGITVVIQGRTAPYGVLGVHSQERRRFSTDDISFLQAVANVLAEAIERARAMASLQESEIRFQALARISPVGIFRTDSTGECVYVNERLCKITDKPSQALMGRGWMNAIHEEDRERIVESWNRTTQKQGTFYEEYRFRKQDDLVTWVICQAVPETDLLGRIVGYVGMITDITQRRRLEQDAQDRRDQLLHVSRLNNMGELASGLAHELNQPLAAVAMYAESCLRMMRSDINSKDELMRILEKIREQSVRAGEIIHSLREFVRKKPHSFELLQVEDLFKEAKTMLEWEMRQETVSFSIQTEDSLPAILGDRIQLQQVLINLIRNAIEAVEESGENECRIQLRAFSSKESMTVQVIDNGPAMPQADLDHIFETFFTSKPEGMGMGLAICRSIIEAHTGRISAHKNADVGLTFEFTLPLARK